MNYRVDAGLYALGEPDAESPVFVTANYKLTFDLFRRAVSSVDSLRAVPLGGNLSSERGEREGEAPTALPVEGATRAPEIDGWILVLDTLGINVWCAAGKGTFGTDELVERIASSRLASIVSHRKLIVPQLGAPGIAAHDVKRRSGFQVVYGPVRAEDLPAFLTRSLKAEGRMRTKDFGFRERLALVPMEVVPALKVALPAAAGLFLLSFLAAGFSLSRALDSLLIPLIAIGTSILAGAVFTPLLLPWLPGRAFSVKGSILGLLSGLLVTSLLSVGHSVSSMGAVALLTLVSAMAAYLAMNFTGSSTVTSLSGVRKEMRIALPLQIGGTAAGLVLWVIALMGG